MDAAVRFAADAPSTSWIDFDMPEESRFIVLPVSLNGTPVDALLDSAVQATAVDRTLAPQLGLRPTGAFTAAGVSGFASGIKTGPVTVGIGNIRLAVSEPSIVDLAPLGVAIARPIVAILGQDVFDPFVVDIDFEMRRIAFRDPAAFVAPHGAIAMPLGNHALGRRSIPVSIEGRPRIPAVLDLGSDAPLCLSRDYVRNMGLFAGKRISTSLSVGVEGLEENRVAVVHAATIGSIEIASVPVEVPRRWTHDAPAIIGIPLLGRFRLAVDFARGRIWMLPHADAQTLSFRKDRLGFAATPESDCLRVVHVSPNSPAHKAGLRIGDDIVAVDDQTVDAAYHKSRRRQGMRPAGTVIHLRLRGGSSMPVTLADYF
jgi:PDZ domain-containing protein/aspartyl protease